MKKSKQPNILVVGAGYVGLATAVYLADKGESVLVVETNRQIINSLRKRKLHFSEPLLEKKLSKVIRNGKLTVDEPTPEAYHNASLIYIAIDSVDHLDWKMRLGTFKLLAQWIGESALPIKTIILKSTNVLGFSELFRKLLDKTKYGKTAGIIVNPEFLREGFAFEDTEKPWRIVVGADSAKHAEPLVKLYLKVYSKKVPIIVTDRKSAELIKLAANLYLSHRLGFIHEIALYARREGLDMDKIHMGIGLDPRVGLKYLSPGLGFGGSCLPKDCHLINSDQAGNRFLFQTAKTALSINERVLDELIDDATKRIGSLKGKKVAILGAAFKPDLDDTRGSRSVALGHKLIRCGAKVVFYEPLLPKGARIWEGQYEPVRDVHAAMQGAHIIVIGTAHSAFRKLIPKRTTKPVIVYDYFEILNHSKWQKLGYQFA